MFQPTAERTPVPTDPEAETDSGLSPGDILRMLWGHKWFILLCALLCFACSALYVHFKKPVYEASASLRVDPGRASSLGLSDLAGNSTSTDLSPTEIAVIQTDGVALRTLNSLPEKDFAELTGLSRQAAALPERAQGLTRAQQHLLDTFKAGISAKQVEGTQLISVSYQSGSPQLAADVANDLVAAYIYETFLDRDTSVAQLRTWLAAQMASLKSQVDASQQKLAAFEEANNVIETQGTSNNITDRLRVLTDSVAKAQADRITKEAQLRAARAGDAGTLAALFPDARLEALQGQAAALNGRYQQLSSKFGPNYPPLIETAKQLQAANADVAAEIQFVRRKLQQEFDTTNTTQRLLESEYDAQAKLAYAFNRKQAEYAVLQAEVTSSRDLFDTLRRKLQQASVDAQVNGLDTMLVDDARVPSFPIAPKKSMILGGGLILGAFAGIVAAFLREATSDRLQGAGQITGTATYDVVTSIPRFVPSGKSRREAWTEPSLVVLHAPGSRTTEAYRTLRNLILLSGRQDPPKVLLMMSASREERTSEVTANYALELAEGGFKVLLVDADLQVPSLHDAFGVENRSGVSSLLTGETAQVSSVRPLASAKTLSLLPAGEVLSTSSGVQLREQLRAHLDLWKDEFDYVVLQAPPPLEVSDSLLLAPLADAVLLITRYNVTELGPFSQLQKLLRRIDAYILGVVITDVSAQT